MNFKCHHHGGFVGAAQDTPGPARERKGFSVLILSESCPNFEPLRSINQQKPKNSLQKATARRRPAYVVLMALKMGATVLNEAGASCARAADAYHQWREESCFRLAGAGVGEAAHARRQAGRRNAQRQGQHHDKAGVVLRPWCRGLLQQMDLLKRLSRWSSYGTSTHAASGARAWSIVERKSRNS